MQWLLNLLTEHSLLLLFVVASVGHVIGKIRIKGVSLGVAAILFVGLAVSALNKDLVLPAVYSSLGLVLFVYSIGIASGPSFFASLRNKGLRRNSFVAVGIFLAAIAAVAIYLVANINPAIAAGLFTGMVTNTPSLAGVVDMLSDGSMGADAVALASLPAVGYSIAYPMGVLGPILAIAFWQRRFKIDYKKDAVLAADVVAAGSDLHTKTILVTNKEYGGKTVKSISKNNHWHVVFGRIRRGTDEWLATKEGSKLERGDLVMVIGAPEDVDIVQKELGEESEVRLELDHSQYDRHRMFVSSKAVVGCKIRELRLPQRFGAMITRVRRGDVDMLANKDFVLEPGDRVRVIAPLDKIDALREYLGDSYRAASSINILAIGVGISLGLILGSVPIPLPGGVVFRLGDAGGPLLVGLILGVLRRSGPVVWDIPYTANLTLREFGLILMLAGIGTRSGQTFIDALGSANGLALFLAAAAVSVIIPFVFLPLAYKGLKMPFGIATGVVAALHTQPAVQAYAVQQSDNELPNHGYAIAFPTATIVKIILAQVILIALL
ncbi:MAG TPA: TrkA C-terminal domain-containing protein [Candidatus Saccharimonadales bacterium]